MLCRSISQGWNEIDWLIRAKTELLESVNQICRLKDLEIAADPFCQNDKLSGEKITDN